MLNTFEMRKPCVDCAGPYGRVEKRNGQSCVFCATPGCGRFAYNAPRTETGERQRSVTTNRTGIKPMKRVAVLLRANSRCEMCGVDASIAVLHVGHLISFDEGKKHGLSDDILNHQENLAAMCEECNLGLGDQSVPLRVLLRLTALRLGVRRATA